MEDHDDLMPVFAAQSDLLSATYGEFFLADMIELQDDENKVCRESCEARCFCSRDNKTFDLASANSKMNEFRSQLFILFDEEQVSWVRR